MNEVWVRVRISSLDGSVVKDVDALVDMGATDTAVPSSALSLSILGAPYWPKLLESSSIIRT